MKKSKSTSLRVLFGIMFCFIAVFMLQGKKVYAAASPITLNVVDYDNENIVINNNENTKIYFANEVEANKGVWEVLDVDNPTTTTIDFSWLSASTENVLIFRGEEDTAWLRITIVKRIRKIDVSISYADIASLKPTDTIAPLLNIMTTAGTSATPVTFNDLEWKKGEDGKWQNVTLLTEARLEKYQIMGTILFFRLKAVNDNTDGSKGRRPSSVVRLGITKKASPVAVSVDGGRFTASIKYGKEYRISVNGGDFKSWTKVLDLSNNPIKLEDIVKKAGYTADGLSTAFPDMVLESRDFATTRTAASKIARLHLLEQNTFPGSIKKGYLPSNATAADLKNVYISYNGVKNIAIVIPNASADLPYEYCIQKPSETEFNLQKAAWTTITTSSSIKVLAARAMDQGILHVRQKLIKTNSSFTLASTEATYTINYPSVPKINKTSLTFTKGYGNSLTFNVTLNVANKDLSERRITSIKLGTREISFTQKPEIKDTDNVDITKVNTLEVTLLKESLASMSICYNRILTITYANGTVDKSSVSLTIQNPVSSGSLSLAVAPGTTKGAIVTNSTAISSGDTLVYTIDATKVTSKYTSDTITTGKPFTSGAEIPEVTLNCYVNVYEINSNSEIIRCNGIQVTQIK